MDADGGNRDQLTSGDFACEEPTWSPYGDRIAFEALDGPSFSIGADGGPVERLTASSPGQGVGVAGHPYWGPTP